MRLGIDFGTTRTVVACADRGNYPIVGFLDERGDAVEWFPSVVAERDGHLRFGFAAEACADAPGWTAVRSFKRWLGEGGAPDREVQVGSARLRLIDLIARFLEALRAAVVASARAGDEPLEAVIAVPANAHGAQRFLTMEAFRRAGFVVRGMLNEPSAAGFEYTHRYGSTLNSRRENVLVYDLGGGTFDASLVRVAGRHHDAVATCGINRLGGDDFDSILVEMALAISGAVGLDAHARFLLRESCRTAKESLSPNAKKIVVEVDGQAVTLPLADYYDACAPLVARTLEAMAPIVERADGDDRGDLAGVYVVGGASALGCVWRALKERFGRRAHRSPYPFASIAIGLAICADDEAGYALTDRLTRNFGVFREADGGRDVWFDVLLARELELPPLGERALMREYRAAHNVGHFRFVECSALTHDGAPRGDITPVGDVLFAFDASLRARGDLREVPVERLGAGPLVREVYSVDAHGIVAVTIIDVDSGYTREFRIGA